MTASSAENLGGAAAAAQMYVINLAASTSPMALSHPSSPELKRFTFFVSRQREDGRERFRLHMGYFTTQDEAEALLLSVRDIYPAAWAGPAPTTGMGRRGRIAPGSVVAAAPAKPAPVAAAPAPVAPAAAAPAAPAPVTRLVPAAAKAPAAAPAKPALDSMSNVRDVLAQLSEPGAAAEVSTPAQAAPRPVAAAPVAPATPAAPKGRELSGADALSLLESPVARPAAAPAAPVARAVPVATPVAATPPQAKAPASVPSLPPLKNPFEGLENEPEVRLVTPEDTQTLTDIKLDRQNNAPPCFAVQLIWSVMPVDVAALPHLAIFDAYTLYNVEGNRQGRKWYGLRLGFFSDPNSATQVANYVRSDYKNVAVVPVAVKERDRARGGAAPAPDVNGEPQKTTDADFRREGMEGFELLADDRPPPPRRDIDDTVRAKAPVIGAAQRPAATRAVTPPATAVTAAGKPTGKPAGKRVVVRRRAPTPPPGKTVSAGVGGAEVLESTLEILGASTLSLDDGGRETITDAAARKQGAKKSGGNRFSRLLSKLSGG